MSRIIERALSIINDNLKDQTTSFADPISIKPMARGGDVKGRLLQDEYPTHYLPHVGRQVMADGGAPIKGFEGRVMAPAPIEETPNINQDQIQQASENRAKRFAGKAWDVMSPEQRQQFMSYPDKGLGGVPISEADPQELLRQERAIEMGHHGPWYHGSERIDRVVENNKIDPKRATSGPMPFFTDAPTLASGYAEGKKDTSLSRDDTGDVSNYFTVKAKDLGLRSKADIPVERAWHFLPSDIQKEISEKALRIGYEDPEELSGDFKLHPEGENNSITSEDHYNYILKREAQGNPLKALRILWHDSGTLFNEENRLEDIFKLAGFPHEISQKNAPWTEAKGVLPAMLRIEKPLVTHNVEELNEKVIPHLEQAFAKDRTRKKQYGADQWDKNTRYTPKEWVAQLKEDMAKSDNSYVWTSIPDKITNQLKVLGYDGIIDTGGKGGGQEHRVAIPFYPHQVRSVFAKFNPEDKMSEDITKAEGGDVTAYHGSPHEFEDFDISKIGTGEGAQAYGHGLYFAENEDVAKEYRDALAPGVTIAADGRRLVDMPEHERQVYNYLYRTGSAPEDAITHFEKEAKAENEMMKMLGFEDSGPSIYDKHVDFAKGLKDRPSFSNKGLGHMYEVRLDAHPEKHLLDWDKPLSEQPHISEKFSDSVWFSPEKTGQEFYRDLTRGKSRRAELEGSPIEAFASEKLSQRGIRGIKYKDAGSRSANGDPTHNYVIFDPKHIKTVRRYAAGGGIKAFAFGNSIPHLDQVSDMIDTHDDIQLAPGVEAIDEMENEVSSNQPSPYAKENDLLQPIGQSKMVGDEDMLFDDGLYKAGVSSHAWNNKKSIRYLHHDEDGNPIGALQIMTHGPRTKKATIQNVYVAEDHRRKNIAANLLKRARRDFDVKHSQDLTDQGRAFAKATKAYGGSIPGPKLTEENADDFARRLIAWTFATAPLFQRAAGGAVDDPNGNWEDAFHATHADVQQFDLSKAGSGTTVGGSKAERAIFLTNDPENAKTYLGGQYVSRSKNPHTEEMPYGVGRHYTEGANIMPLKINTKDFDEWDYGGNLYDANHMKEMIKEAKKSKSPGIKIENIKDQGYMGLGSGKKTTTYVVLDPSRIRSKFAKFDPKQSKKRDLMAADGGSVIDAALDVVSKLRR